MRTLGEEGVAGQVEGRGGEGGCGNTGGFGGGGNPEETVPACDKSDFSVGRLRLGGLNGGVETPIRGA